MSIAAALALAVGPFAARAQKDPGPGGLSSPPQAGPPRSVKFPEPREKTLPNGLRVIAIERKGLPLVTAELAIASGAETDPPLLAGLADFTAALLTKGTKTRTAPEIAAAIEALGGSLDATADWDMSAVSTTVMASKLDRAAEILADVVRRPTFAAEEVERYRSQALDDLDVELSRPGSVARFVAARLLYGDAPYGHPAEGTPESLARVARADVAAMHAAHYRPANAVFLVGGDISAEAVFELAERRFGDWTNPATALPRTPRLPVDFAAATEGRVLVVDKPDAGQAAVVLVRPGIRRTDPQYYPGLVANSVLGGGYSARLNYEIRIKRGLSYGASSRLDARRDVGPFLASTQTRNDAGAEVAGLLLQELERLGQADVAAAELGPRQAALTGNFARRLETTRGLVAEIAGFAVHGLPLDTANAFIPGVQGVSAADVKAFARSRLDPRGASLVLVGDAGKFLAPLEKAFSTVDVIRAADLDLDSATLRKPQDPVR